MADGVDTRMELPTKTCELDTQGPNFKNGGDEMSTKFQENSNDVGNTNQVAAPTNQTDLTSLDPQDLGSTWNVTFPAMLAQSGWFGPFLLFVSPPHPMGQQKSEDGQCNDRVLSSLKRRRLHRSPSGELMPPFPAFPLI